MGTARDVPTSCDEDCNTRHLVILVGTVGVFSPPSPPLQWFLRVFMSEVKKSTRGGGGGGEGAQLFVRNMGTARGVPAKCDEDCR